MTRIHMDTEVVRETARLLNWTAGELDSLPSKLKNLAGSISGAWQGGRSSHYANELRKVSNNLQQEVVNLQRLAVRVGSEVNEWEDADAAFGRIASTIASAPQPKTSWWDYSEAIKNFVDDIGIIGSGLAISSLIGGISAGASYAGQAVFKGGQGLKEMAGLSKNLTHIKAANLPSHLLKQAGKIGALDVGMAAWEFANKAGEDWAHYEKGSEKAAALGIDALFVTGKTVVAQYAAYAVTTAAVGLLTTAGAPAVVVAAGGLAIWWGGSYVIENILDKGYKAAESSGVKDSMVKTGGSLLESSGRGIRKAAETVDRAFDPVIQSAQVYAI
ncbi:MAG: hypothetical protein B6D38_03725 [Anaerolineae bacterium UTCFX1]|jgi:uncharacterized protein YukE|nr:MAG: hypothetical protein B6D38_03725 [Anaerolineae bacterium UTCFX1]